MMEVRGSGQIRLHVHHGGLVRLVGPGTLDQELQEPKGLHQNQITSKKPPDSKGNQEAEMAAAKGLLPHEDHRRTKS